MNGTKRGAWSLLRRLGVITVASATGLVAATVSPSGALVSKSLSNGVGGFTAVSAADFVPGPVSPSPNPCSVYTAYSAEIAYTSGGDDLVANVHSDPLVKWGEDPAGTHPDTILFPDCSGGVAAISGFSGAIAGKDASGAVVACTLTGSYKRVDLAVTFTMTAAVAARCPYSSVTMTANIAGATLPEPIPTLTENVPIFGAQDWASACAGIIAPPACVFGPQL